MNCATLREDIIIKIKNNSVLTGYLAQHLKVGYRTLLRYLDDNNPILTQWSALSLIQEHLIIANKADLVNEFTQAEAA